MICPDSTRNAAAPLGCFEHQAMACTFGLTLEEPDPQLAASAAQVAWDEVDRLERALSRFVPTSDITRVSALVPGESTIVGIEAWECLMVAAALAEASHGAFDVTHASRRDVPHPAAPDPAPKDANRPFFFRALSFDPPRRAVGVRLPGVRIDLGAIGKGYALDQCAVLLRDWGIERALLHCGQSSAFAIGTRGSGEPWRVALRDPLDQQGALGHVALAERALSGSGRVIHGEHIVDARSGHPPGATLAAWSLARGAAWSDGLSTAAMLLEPEELRALCAAVPGSGVCILRRSADVVERLTFGEWPGDEQDESNAPASA